ncbi:MAG: Uma2 family endonuclease [Treponema sp.]|jgi:Uma2 family endonuclease|nr:Uma2 family endonuclease [Treponema sp.]
MMPALKKEEGKNHYTYAEYLSWDTDKRCELINGEAWMMAAPSVAHQTISRELLGQFWNFLKGKPCEVFAAPLDVRLFPKDDDSDDTVVQPDILVVCDKSKIADNRACRGAPDMVIEIRSPSNTETPLFLKFSKYLRAEVREYWLIDPETRDIQVHILEKKEGSPGHYISTICGTIKTLEVSILPGMIVDFSSIWNAF